jgi:hypothetical protein
VLSLLLWALVAGVCALAVWIAQLVKGTNDRFDQIEHKLDVIIDEPDRDEK